MNGAAIVVPIWLIGRGDAGVEGREESVEGVERGREDVGERPEGCAQEELGEGEGRGGRWCVQVGWERREDG